MGHMSFPVFLETAFSLTPIFINLSWKLVHNIWNLHLEAFDFMDKQTLEMCVHNKYNDVTEVNIHLCKQYATYN